MASTTPRLSRMRDALAKRLTNTDLYSFYASAKVCWTFWAAPFCGSACPITAVCETWKRAIANDCRISPWKAAGNDSCSFQLLTQLLHEFGGLSYFEMGWFVKQVRGTNHQTIMMGGFAVNLWMSLRVSLQFRLSGSNILSYIIHWTYRIITRLRKQVAFVGQKYCNLETTSYRSRPCVLSAYRASLYFQCLLSSETAWAALASYDFMLLFP